MTMQEKKTRIDKLAESPAFFYRTLREAVEQLDSTKQTFQFLLAAHERTIDPDVRAQYEAGKLAGRTELLRNNPAGVAPRTLPVEQTPLGPVTIIKGDGVADDTASVKAAGGISIPAGALSRLSDWAKTEEQPQDQPAALIAEDGLGLSSEALLEAKRMASMDRAAQEVNRMLEQNGIRFTPEQLRDYMERKLSKSELLRIMEQSNVAPVAQVQADPPQAIVPGSEFDLTQVGAAQKMFYQDGGLLSKILGPTIHRYGKGPVQDIAGFITAHHPFGTPTLISIKTESYARGLYTTLPGQPVFTGLLLPISTRDPHNPDVFWAWLPQYSPTSTQPPMIYVKPAVQDGESFRALNQLASAVASDLINRIVHALVLWTKELEMQAMTPPVELASPKAPVEHNPAVTTKPQQYVMPGDSKQYPADHALGKLQSALYAKDGLLAKLFGPSLHHAGTGKINTIDYFATDAYVNTENGAGIFIEGQPKSGLHFTRGGGAGLLIRPVLDNPDLPPIQFWLPLHIDGTQPMPSLYVSTPSPYVRGEPTNMFYNLDTYLSSDRNTYTKFLVEGLQQFAREHGVTIN